MEAVQAAADAETARMEAVQAATDAETARMEAVQAAADAEQRATDAETARTEAVQAKEAADAKAADYKTMADDAQQAEADALNALAEAQRQLAIAQGMVDAESAAATATRAGMLASVMDVIHSFQGVDHTATPDDDFADIAADPPVAAQPQDDIYPGMVVQPDDAPMPRTGLTFTHTDAAGVKIARINNTPVEFQEYEVADVMAPAIAGWESVTLERRNDRDAATQTIYSYTDIATASVETFLEKYGSMLSAGELTVDMDNLAPAKSGSFPTRTEADVSFAARSPAFAGTYDGVPGEFQCTAGPCVVMADDTTGELSIDAQEEFTFTPTDLNTVIAKADGDYLYFGYWLHKPDAPGGGHGFSLIAGGSDRFTVRGDDNPATTVAETGYSIVHVLAGEARYSGPAAGKYVTRNVIANTAKIGQFTATADLIASFGTATTEGDVDGVIRDFMEGGESLGNWRVTLGDASLAQIGLASGDTAGVQTDNHLAGRTATGHSMTQFTGPADARIGASGAGGDWVGTFHGNDRTDGKPEAIAGMFEVNAPHAAISGSFGAKNTAQ